MKSPLDLVREKIMDENQLLKTLLQWRFRNQRIVFTNGCFDILHRGHIEYLAVAASYGTRLIVGLNSDESVRKLKGEGRPVNSFPDRALALAALRFTDAIAGFSEDTPERLIEQVRPDVLIKGGDYQEHQVAGAGFVRSYGGAVKIVPLTEGYSTTRFIEGLR